MKLRFTLLILAASLGGAAAACSSSDGALFGDPGSDGAAPDAPSQHDGSSTTPPPEVDATTPGDDADVPERDGGGGKDAEARDSGKDAKGTDDSGNDSGNDSGALDAGALDAGADGECGAPFKVFATDAGPFCPFTIGGPARCAMGQHCCEYLADSGLSSTCNEANAACAASPGVVDWGCDEANDCPSNEVCCFVGTVVKDRPECPLYHGVNVSGTVCRPGACNAGEKVVCGSQADCAQGDCVGMNMRGKDLGFCK